MEGVQMTQDQKLKLLQLAILIRAEMEHEKKNNAEPHLADNALGDITMRLKLKIKDFSDIPILDE